MARLRSDDERLRLPPEVGNVCLSLLFLGKPCCEQPHTTATMSELGTAASVKSLSDDSFTATVWGVPEPEPPAKLFPHS